MIKYFVFLVLVVLLTGCKKKDESSSTPINFNEGMYMGYFEYQENSYWCEIEFSANKYIEWPSGGAWFQKSYSCLTTGSYSVVDNKLTFKFETYKMPDYPEVCNSDMLMAGEYLITNTLNSDSLVFEKGSNNNKIKYFLVKLQLN
ncbi:MAG: hypothetical protein WCI31_17200 [Prolixibacteraceae bacterium]